MRRYLLFLLLFLLLLFVPLGARYVYYYDLGGSTHQAPDDYELGDVASLVPTPAFSNVAFLPAETRGQVLLDLGHDNDVTLDELGFLDGQLAARGYELVSFSGEDLARALRPASALVVIAPLKGFSADEIRAVVGFAARGGRVLLVGDPTRFSAEFGEDEFGFITALSIVDDQLPLNSLANAFGIVFGGDYLYNTVVNEGNFRNIIVGSRGLNAAALTEGLDQVVLYGSHSVRVSAAGTPLLQADDNTWSSATDRPGGLAMGAISGDQSALALGDLNFLIEPYATAYDNSQFIERVIGFLTEADRTVVLDDFPYFFSSQIDLIYAGSPDLGPDAFDEIIALQSAFRAADRDLNLAPSPVSGHDALYLGLYNQADDVADLLQAADITLTIDPPLPEMPVPVADTARDEAPAVAATPEPETRLLQGALGNVQMSGTALLFLGERDGARVLVVLAASGAGLESTVDRLLRLIPSQAPDVLADCLLRDTLALCPTEVAAEPVEARLDTSGAPQADAGTPADEETTPTEETGDLFDPADIGALLQGTVALEETVSATLGADEDHAWRVSGGPVTVDIRLSTDEPSLDPVLEIFDAAGEMVAEADNGFSGDEEWLLAIEIPDTATYTIVVKDFYREGGAYSLSVLESRPPEGVLIFADDDGLPATSGFTGADTFRALLGDEQAVTLWRTSVDGPITVETLLRHELIIWTSGDYRTDTSVEDLDANVLLNYLFFNDAARMLIAGATPALFEPSETALLADVTIAQGTSPLLAGLTPGETFALTSPLDAVLLNADSVGPDDRVLLTRGADSDGPGQPVALANEEANRGSRIVLLAVPFDVLPEPLRTILFANALEWLRE